MKEIIRLAKISDSDEILDIYAKYILETTISFEIEVPSRKEFKDRVARIMNTYPYLVYEIDDKIIGYAYASQHGERAAYCFDVDVSIYFLEDYHGNNNAKKLYSTLFNILIEQGIYNVYAAYTQSNIKSEYFHKKMGFKEIATFHNVGYKFNQWLDVTWVGKQLLPYDRKPTEIISIKNLSSNLLHQLLNKVN